MATLRPASVEVTPGGPASFELRVRGAATPEQLRFEVVGDAAAWSWVVPPPVAGRPDGEVLTRLVLRPPRAPEPKAGDHRVAVRVWASGDVPQEATAEGVIRVEGFAEVAGSLRPALAEGRSATAHELTIDVNANTPVTVSVTPVENDALDLHVSHRGVTQVLVRPKRRLLRGSPRSHRFAVQIVSDLGEPVTVSGEMRQLPLLAGRAPAAVGLVLVSVVSALVILGTRSGRSGSSASDPTPGAAASSGCVAEGHRDTFVSGLTPDRIPTLPSGWSFSFVKDDGCSPVRFNPCQPVHFVLNPARAPSSGVADAREAFSRLGRATGIDFVDDGTTDETSRKGPYDGDRYPGRWAPVLVVWTHQSGGRADIEVVGSGFPTRVGDTLVSGTLTLNSDAVTNRARSTPVPGGFGTGAATGVGAIGAEGVTWGRVILHELAHIMGLGHTRDRDQLMYPDTAEQTAQTTDYRGGDRDGLRLLGREAGCPPDAPVPA